MSSLERLALELRREAEEIFRATGEVIVVAPTDESAEELILVAQTRSLKVSHVVDKNVIRWETEREYGFERIPEPPTPLAKTLMRKVRC
jgi:hypothetical protein